jgi:hypothetical protein
MAMQLLTSKAGLAAMSELDAVDGSSTGT